jgi:hypothetical protein
MFDAKAYVLAIVDAVQRRTGSDCSLPTGFSPSALVLAQAIGWEKSLICYAKVVTQINLAFESIRDNCAAGLEALDAFGNAFGNGPPRLAGVQP